MTHSLVKALCAMLRELQSELPVYDELGEPNADTARIRVWRDSVEDIVPDGHNYKVQGTISIEYRADATDTAQAERSLAQHIAAVDELLGTTAPGQELDARGCPATLLDRIHAGHDPITYTQGFWCAIVRWRAYLQY